MLEIFSYPSRAEWESLITRPSGDSRSVFDQVLPILKEVREKGDEAVRTFTEKFDKVYLEDLFVSEEEFSSAGKKVPADLKEAIRTAIQNIERFHQTQQVEVVPVETMEGVSCWRKALPIEKVGLYVPGGTAPLFSTVLMLGVPAKIAACQEVILATPPDINGEVHPAILFAAQEVGIRKILKAGGAQAIAAMAYGTESVSRVFKIFGPGNQYVTAAKQLVSQEGVAIDMPAGPSEVLVVMDQSASAAFAASDLLAQAEHGADSQVILLADSAKQIEETRIEISRQLSDLPRKEIAEAALQNSRAIVLKKEDLMDFVNLYAPEHLILLVEDSMAYAEKVLTAGSVFLGHYSPESVGDYASGTNHTLPTNAYARAYSGVSLESFQKKITFQKLSSEGLKNIGPTVELMAEAEQLEAHKRAIRIRINQLDEES